MDVWKDAEPRFPGEQLVHVTVNSRVEAAFYFSGNFRTKTEAFSYACEVMFADGYAEAPAAERQAADDFDFRYLVWASSDMFEYDIVTQYEGAYLEGRALVEGEGERVSVDDTDKVTDYAYGSTTVDPAEFGADGDKDENFDESAYHREVAARSKPYSPQELIQKTLKITRQDVILALHKAWDGKGRVLWPEGGAKDTDELRKELETAEPCMVGLPLWTEWGEQYVPPQTPPTPKKTAQKKAQKKP